MATAPDDLPPRRRSPSFRNREDADVSELRRTAQSPWWPSLIGVLAWPAVGAFAYARGGSQANLLATLAFLAYGLALVRLISVFKKRENALRTLIEQAERKTDDERK